MKNIFLILGATGGIGFSFTNELITRKIHSTIFVRNKEKANQLFGKSEYLEIIEGDINDSKKLMKISKGKKFIFFGINFPYQEWESKFKPALDIVIKASREAKATILFPENNYAFGNVSTPIKESTIPDPTTKKGAVRLKLVQHLKAATKRNDCKAIVVRLPDFFGPNVTNGLMKPIFENAIKNKPMQWLINGNIPHQFAFTPDIAKLFYDLSQEEGLPDYYLLNYSGETVSSIKTLCETISSFTNNSSDVKVTPKFILNMISYFSPEVKSLKENFYQFENTIKLDDTKFSQSFPDFRKTQLSDAVKITIDWYSDLFLIKR